MRDEMVCVQTQFQSDANFAEHKWFKAIYNTVNISSFFHNFQCDAICGYSELHTRFRKHTSIFNHWLLKGYFRGDLGEATSRLNILSKGLVYGSSLGKQSVYSVYI